MEGEGLLNRWTGRMLFVFLTELRGDFADGGNGNSVYFLCPVLGSAGLCMIAVTDNSLDFKLFYYK